MGWRDAVWERESRESWLTVPMPDGRWVVRMAFDLRTQQWPANNRALIHAVAAYLQASRLQAKCSTSNEARPCSIPSPLPAKLDQSCARNPNRPSMLLGGFTTQNPDGEWSDARQSLAGEVILDYYRATHNPEYLERGVEALRAQFPVPPSKNWAHSTKLA